MNTANTTHLNWIEQLPEVGTPILRQRDDLLGRYGYGFHAWPPWPSGWFGW